MTTTVTQKTEIIGGKEYPLKVTRQRGLQEIEVRGEKIKVVSVTISEGPLGTTLCYTRFQPEMTREGWEAVKQRTREIAVQAMIDQGIW